MRDVRLRCSFHFGGRGGGVVVLLRMRTIERAHATSGHSPDLALPIKKNAHVVCTQSMNTRHEHILLFFRDECTVGRGGGMRAFFLCEGNVI